MYNRNVILRYLDAPLRIAFWTIDEAQAIIIPLSIGLVFGWPLLGVISSIGCYLSLKYIKRYFGGGLLRHIIYWYFPGSFSKTKFKIKSYIRKYIG
ncbi:MAG: type IV conjugative transfer system protein TraL [Rickettsiales bacterium]|nr:MAG: type IV conjugative transfer system protein TraL [Rickettsiales bacterium]